MRGVLAILQGDDPSRTIAMVSTIVTPRGVVTIEGPGGDGGDPGLLGVGAISPRCTLHGAQASGDSTASLESDGDTDILRRMPRARSSNHPRIFCCGILRTWFVQYLAYLYLIDYLLKLRAVQIPSSTPSCVDCRLVSGCRCSSGTIGTGAPRTPRPVDENCQEWIRRTGSWSIWAMSKGSAMFAAQGRLSAVHACCQRTVCC